MSNVTCAYSDAVGLPVVGLHTVAFVNTIGLRRRHQFMRG